MLVDAVGSARAQGREVIRGASGGRARHSRALYDCGLLLLGGGFASLLLLGGRDGCAETAIRFVIAGGEAAARAQNAPL